MKITSEELKDAIETARGGEALLGPTYLHDLLVRQSTNIAAELLRCRELLAGMVDSCSCNCGGFENGEFCRQPNCVRCGEAKKYLSETEG